MQDFQFSDYKLLLLEELAERRRRNPAYSLTAFSKSLGLSAPTLSQVMSGKRPLSRKAAKKIIERCLFSEEKRKCLLESTVGADTEKLIAGNANAEGGYQEVQIDTFNVISDWYHYAILSLGDIKPNNSDPKWISEQLGISVTEASKAFDRLLRLRLIKKKNGSFFQSSAPISMPGNAPHAALRKHLHQNLRKAEDALDSNEVPMELFSDITMAIDESKLPEARALIRNFRRRLCKLVENGKRERVYTLAVQLFPVSKRKDQPNEQHD